MQPARRQGKAEAAGGRLEAWELDSQIRTCADGIWVRMPDRVLDVWVAGVRVGAEALRLAGSHLYQHTENCEDAYHTGQPWAAIVTEPSVHVPFGQCALKLRDAAACALKLRDAAASSMGE